MEGEAVDSGTIRTRSSVPRPAVVALGVGCGVVLFLITSQLSSTWLSSTSVAGQVVPLVAMVPIVAGAVAGAWSRPEISVWAGLTLVVLLVGGFILGAPSDVMGPTSVLDPIRLAKHGGRSPVVVAVASAVLMVAVLRRSKALSDR